MDFKLPVELSADCDNKLNDCNKNSKPPLLEIIQTNTYPKLNKTLSTLHHYPYLHALERQAVVKQTGHVLWCAGSPTKSPTFACR